MAHDGAEGSTVETTNDKRNKETRTAKDGSPDTRDASAPREETDDPQSETGVTSIVKESYDEAINKGVEDIHG